MKNTELKKGMIVSYGKGHMRITACFKETVNLGGVWGSKTTVKKVPKSEVKEDSEAFYSNWRQSETYMCM